MRKMWWTGIICKKDWGVLIISVWVSHVQWGCWKLIWIWATFRVFWYSGFRNWQFFPTVCWEKGDSMFKLQTWLTFTKCLLSIRLWAKCLTWSSDSTQQALGHVLLLPPSHPVCVGKDILPPRNWTCMWSGSGQVRVCLTKLLAGNRFLKAHYWKTAGQYSAIPPWMLRSRLKNSGPEGMIQGAGLGGSRKSNTWETAGRTNTVQQEKEK